MSVKALSNLSGGYPKSAAGITITSAFVAGWVLALFGGWIRRKCYQTLGRLFTFELAIRKDHHLVTSGPYSFVRHPSYTGTISAMAGTLLVGLTPGSWLRECGLLQSWIGRVIAGIWILNAVFFCGLVGCRTRQEDEALRKEFGGVWDKWASEVRYRLVPFVY
ncbi:hypothetical protein JAAARDRAFT_41283 [Jaapia argillacea MUCL 33604]|uniref:Protein-S-isoprenylcysteine O-methyltransferase n=1 Tax=Jaapia argillacea MUCL 33604 TaxID=933084 RepID=A0A067PJL6_9AGAM|nr:hypothetical protein JAAARDRAFT_41283 [Jaapia argillacea MUCL 33604]